MQLIQLRCGISEGWEYRWAENWVGKDISWPTILITPEEIFTGKVLALNVNFLKDISGEVQEIDSDADVSDEDFRESLLEGGQNTIGTKGTENALIKLREQIAQWYLLIRNLAAAALFCVLIYIGIRMVISSASEEKAKYKSMLVNWVVAICLVFFLHYLMSTIMFVTEKMVDIIGSGLSSEYVVCQPGGTEEEKFVLSKIAKPGLQVTEIPESEREEAKVYNLLELVRVYINAENRFYGLAYLLVYMTLIVFTCIFIFKYLKRFMYMAFLTMIAPVIAFTYPIDKMKDGSAQAFNMWFKEYLFNALLQPVHLLIYVVLVGTATELVTINFIYAIVALYFINKAEDILKKFFGLDQASTTGGAGAFAKGALASQALSKVKGGKSSKSIGSKSSGGSGKSSSKPRQSKGLEAYTKDGDKEALSAGKDKATNINLTDSVQGEHQGKLGPAEDSKSPNDGKGNNNKFGEENSVTKGQTSDSNNGSKNKMSRREARKEQRKIKGYKRTKAGAIGMMGLKALGKGATYTAKKVGRGSIRAVAAASGAMLGGAMAIATGNTTYLAAGAGIGYALGGKAADVPWKAVSAVKKGKGAIKTAYREERLGVQGAAAKQRYDDFKKDSDNIDYFKEEFNVDKKEAKNIIEEGREFIEAGYTNPEDVSRLIKMQRESNSSSDQIMAADQMASQLKIDDFLDEKKSASLQSNLTEQMRFTAQANGMEISEAKASELAQRHINSMRIAKGLSAQPIRQQPKPADKPKSATEKTTTQKTNNKPKEGKKKK